MKFSFKAFCILFYFFITNFCLANPNYTKTIRLLTKKRESTAGSLLDIRPDRLMGYYNKFGVLEDMIEEQHLAMQKSLKEQIEREEKLSFLLADLEKKHASKASLSRDEYSGIPSELAEETLAILYKSPEIKSEHPEPKKLLAFLFKHSQGIVSLWDLKNLKKFGHYLGSTHFGLGELDNTYKKIIFMRMELLDWKSQSVHDALGIHKGLDPGSEWNMEKDLPALLEHYHTVGLPTYFFLSKDMSSISFLELEFLIENPELLKNVTFVLGTDYILKKKPKLAEFSFKLFGQEPIDSSD